MQNELFKECEVVSKAPPPVNNYPFVIFAYWPGGGWWTLTKDRYSSADCKTINDKIEKMKSAGWSYITVLKLPNIT